MTMQQVGDTGSPTPFNSASATIQFYLQRDALGDDAASGRYWEPHTIQFGLWHIQFAVCRDSDQ